MGRKRTSVLSKNPGHKIKMEFRVDPALKEELQQLHERLERELPDQAFDASQRVEDFLREEIRAAHRELDSLGGKKPAAGTARTDASR